MITQASSELRVAVAAVCEAAQVCRQIQASIPPARDKHDRSPVTVADFASQALICRALRESFAEDPVVAEEDVQALGGPEAAEFRKRVAEALQPFGVGSQDEALALIGSGGGSGQTERFWTLDPIDGTKGFLRGDQYAIALALVVDGEPVVAALACPELPCGPARGTVLWAVRGQGTFYAPLDDRRAATKASVSLQPDPTQIRACESFESSHSAHDHSAQVLARLGTTAAVVRMDSQAKYGAVARGDAEVYLRLPTRADYREKIWDHAAGALVVEQAGGRVTDIEGRALQFTHGRELSANRGVIVTHGRLHDQVLAAIGP